MSSFFSLSLVDEESDDAEDDDEEDDDESRSAAIYKINLIKCKLNSFILFDNSPFYKPFQTASMKLVVNHE